MGWSLAYNFNLDDEIDINEAIELRIGKDPRAGDLHCHKSCFENKSGSRLLTKKCTTKKNHFARWPRDYNRNNQNCSYQGFADSKRESMDYSQFYFCFKKFINEERKNIEPYFIHEINMELVGEFLPDFIINHTKSNPYGFSQTKIHIIDENKRRRKKIGITRVEDNVATIVLRISEYTPEQLKDFKRGGIDKFKLEWDYLLIPIKNRIKEERIEEERIAEEERIEEERIDEERRNNFDETGFNETNWERENREVEERKLRIEHQIEQISIKFEKNDIEKKLKMISDIKQGFWNSNETMRIITNMSDSELKEIEPYLVEIILDNDFHEHDALTQRIIKYSRMICYLAHIPEESRYIFGQNYAYKVLNDLGKVFTHSTFREVHIPNYTYDSTMTATKIKLWLIDDTGFEAKLFGTNWSPSKGNYYVEHEKDDKNMKGDLERAGVICDPYYGLIGIDHRIMDFLEHLMWVFSHTLGLSQNSEFIATMQHKKPPYDELSSLISPPDISEKFNKCRNIAYEIWMDKRPHFGEYKDAINEIVSYKSIDS